MESTTRHLETPEVTLAYDVRGPLPTADGRPPLMMVGSPMDARGFATLAGLFGDRTVVTYDPRGLGRSTRHDDRTEITPELNAADQHAIIEALGVGPVDMFASSGGAVSALALVAGYPGDVATLVAHEPPLVEALPDADRARAAWQAVEATYHEKGWGHGMAAFIGFTIWPGEFTDDYFAQPAADPATFGMPAEDDGTRTDPLLSGVSNPITAYRPPFDAIAAGPTRVVIGVGEESAGIFTGRTSLAAATALGQQATVFPGGHGGFAGDEYGQPGVPEPFAAKLRELLGSASS
jgi:pimeloyl-ACP methyl ester carboxylesterase